jgi:DNA replication and repair protein RecF
MRVDGVTLRGFRNYEEASASFDDGINVISGKNAQGKTNLLEAVYMLAGGKSFRTRFDRELIGFDGDFAEIEGRIFAEGRDQTVRIRLCRGQRKQILQNGVKKTGTELGETFAAVLFCPDDLNLIREGAAARRRLMDLAISQLRPTYGALLSDYTRLYEHKSRILKDWREKPDLLDTLDAFSGQMCVLSAQIIRYRASFAEKLAAAAAPIHSEFSGQDEQLAIAYRTVSTVTNPTASTQEILEEVLLHQERHRTAEISAGSCLTGIHKDDLEITLNGRSARSFASQGQARTAALSIKLAERELHRGDTGEYPVLLLDDVLSELDARRQAFVLNRIGGGQTLITCCEDEEIARKTGGKVLLVDGGRIFE